MTIAEWCVFGAVMLYLLTIAPFKVIGLPRFDNSKPRDPAFFEDPLSRSGAGRAHQRHRELSVLRHRRVAGGIPPRPTTLDR